MPNKRKICTENLNSNQSIYIPSLNSYYPPENVINSAYRKVLDFKENAEKILEKEKLETLCLDEFSKAILDSRSFEISLQHNCIKLKCYITLEKDKDAKKKRNEQLQQQQQQMHQQQQQHGMHTPPDTPLASNSSQSSHQINDSLYDSLGSPVSMYAGNSAPGGVNHPTTTTTNNNSGGAKKVNVEVIMKSNPFRVEENEKTTRMELIRNNNGDNSMLRFTYYVRPECEAKKFRDSSSEIFEKGRLVVFTNDFFTVYQDATTGEMNISLNEIVQTPEEQKRTEALGEKLFTLLKDRPRHRALLTNECKLNHSLSAQYMNMMPMSMDMKQQQQAAFNDLASFYANNAAMMMSTSSSTYALSPASSMTSQEDETYYTRELIHIYGQPIVPSFHKHFNYQLSNTHYGYRTLRRLLNCDILKKYVKITKEEIKSLDRVVEFVQLTNEKCLAAFQLNITAFYDPARFENGIVKNWLDVWYVDRLKEKYAHNESTLNKDFICSASTPPTPYSQSLSPVSHLTSGGGSTTGGLYSSSWSPMPPVMSTSPGNSNSNSSANSCFLQTSQCDHEESECDQANHLWFCLKDYSCLKMEEFMHKLKDYISIKNNKSELILVHTAHPVFEYKDVLSEARRILAIFLTKSLTGKYLDELVSKKLPAVAREHVESLLSKFLNLDSDKKIVGFTALFEILLVLKRELIKEKSDEMKYSHFLCTLERSNQERLKMAIMQLKCVPCLNKFTTNFNLINNSSSSSSSSLMNSNSSSSSLNSSSKNMVSHANMSRLLKQMSLIVSTELQQIAIDLVERMDEDKPVKYIKLKDEFKFYGAGAGVVMSSSQGHMMQHSPIGGSRSQQQQQQHAGSNMIPIPSSRHQSLMHASSSSSALSSNTNSSSSSAAAASTLAFIRRHMPTMDFQNLASNFQQLDLAPRQPLLPSSSSSSSSATLSTSASSMSLTSSSSSSSSSTTAAGRLNIINPRSNLKQLSDQKQSLQDSLAALTSASIDRCCSATNSLMFSDRI